MAATEKGQVFTGARARLLINGVKIGWATGVSGSESITYEPIKVLDNIQVQEFVPVAYEVTLSASRVRIIGKTMKSQGFFPSVGGSADEHLRNILTNGDLVVQVEDTITGRIYANYEQVKVSDVSWSIDAVGVTANEVTFVAIRARDESEVQ
jgi:hypothetical protein